MTIPCNRQYRAERTSFAILFLVLWTMLVGYAQHDRAQHSSFPGSQAAVLAKRYTLPAGSKPLKPDKDHLVQPACDPSH